MTHLWLALQRSPGSLRRQPSYSATATLHLPPAAKSCELARSMVSHCQAEARRIIWDLRDTDEVTNILSQALSRRQFGDSLGEHRQDRRVHSNIHAQCYIAPGGPDRHRCSGRKARSVHQIRPRLQPRAPRIDPQQSNMRRGLSSLFRRSPATASRATFSRVAMAVSANGARHTSLGATPKVL